MASKRSTRSAPCASEAGPSHHVNHQTVHPPPHLRIEMDAMALALAQLNWTALGSHPQNPLRRTNSTGEASSDRQ